MAKPPLTAQGRILLQHIGNLVPSAEKLEDGLHGYPRARDDGATIADGGINENALFHAQTVPQRSDSAKCGGRRRGGLLRGERRAFVVERAGFFQEVIVATRIGHHLAAGDVQRFRGKLADEMHVVGNED